MRSLRQEHGGPLRFAGIGGQAMQAEGLQSLFPMEDLSVMGFAEVLPRLPRLRARLHQAIASVRELQPRLVVGIDSKGFNLRLLRALADEPGGSAEQCAHTSHQRPALVQYVAPSAWAFRDAERRASRLAGWLDELLLLLPFEQALYERAGVRCTFVGHPSLEDDSGLPAAAGRMAAAAAFRSRHALCAAAPTVCLLPGSRAQELRGTLPPMLEAAELLNRELSASGGGSAGPSGSGLQLVLAAPRALRSLAESILRSHSNLPRVVVVDSAERFDAYSAAQLALACSGTVNMELALAGTPQVALYRTSWLTAFYIRAILRPTVQHATLPNILAQREVGPRRVRARLPRLPTASRLTRQPCPPGDTRASLRAVRTGADRGRGDAHAGGPITARGAVCCTA